jgi:hypothetical protein
MPTPSTVFSDSQNTSIGRYTGQERGKSFYTAYLRVDAWKINPKPENCQRPPARQQAKNGK